MKNTFFIFLVAFCCALPVSVSADRQMEDWLHKLDMSLAASPLVNGNKWYTEYVNDKNEQIFNTTYDHNKWVKAAQACKLCIDEAEKAGYALYVEMGPNGKPDPFLSTYNVHIKRWSEGNHEITFPVTKGNSYRDTFLRTASVREYGGGNGLGVYQGLVDAFFTRNGLPINDPNSGYEEEGFSTTVDNRSDVTTWEYGTGNPGEVTARGTYNMYCNREPRFYNAVSFHGSWLAVGKRKYIVQHTHWDYGRNGKGFYNDIFAPGWVIASLWELYSPQRTVEFLK